MTLSVMPWLLVLAMPPPISGTISRPGPSPTLYEEYPWLVYWALGALAIGALSLSCACCFNEKMT